MNKALLLRICAVAVAACVFVSIADAGEPAQKKENTVADPAVPVMGTSQSKPMQPIGDRKFVVYYFHGNARCVTCHKLENFAKAAIDDSFGKEIKNGVVTWKAVNVETKGNEHFADDYKLYTKSVIISVQRNGKEISWKNLEKIWELVRNEKDYREYIVKEVTACIEGKCL